MEKHIIFISVMIDQNTKALSAIIYIYIHILLPLIHNRISKVDTPSDTHL